MRGVLAYVASPRGSKVFQQLKHDNTREFPEYVEELRGLAEGAGVALDGVWCANLLSELGNLMAAESSSTVQAAKGCSDLFAVARGGYSEGFAEGHNEDWSDALKPFLYYIAYTFDAGAASPSGEPGPPFSDCASLGYPAHMPGSTPSWNRFGLYATVNHLTPRRPLPGGLGVAFVKRRALCEASGIDGFVAALTVPGWSGGISANVVDLRARRMANVEIYEDQYSVVEVTERLRNYSHFNEYRHLRTSSGLPIDDPRSFANDPRQARTDDLPPVRSEADVRRGLSDEQVFSRKGTIATLVINGSTGNLSVWCCGVPAAAGPPTYRWNLWTFFDAP